MGQDKETPPWYTTIRSGQLVRVFPDRVEIPGGTTTWSTTEIQDALIAKHGYQPQWLEFGVGSGVDSLLTKDSVVLEWGAGQSTLWLAKRCKRLISIENDSAWYNRVRNWLRDERITNTSLIWQHQAMSTLEANLYEFDFVFIDNDCPQNPHPSFPIEENKEHYSCLRTRSFWISYPYIKKDGYLFLDDQWDRSAHYQAYRSVEDIKQFAPRHGLTLIATFGDRDKIRLYQKQEDTWPQKEQ